MHSRMMPHKPDVGLLVLRVGVGVIFLAHGIQKYQAGAEQVAAFMQSIGLMMPLLMAYIVMFVETFGGLALIVGAASRLAAVLLAVVMSVAILSVKGALGLLGGYELDLALLVGCLAIFFAGPGAYSIDYRKEGSHAE